MSACSTPRPRACSTCRSTWSSAATSTSSRAAIRRSPRSPGCSRRPAAPAWRSPPPGHGGQAPRGSARWATARRCSTDGATAVFFADLTDALAEERRAAEAQRFAEVGRIAGAMAHELKSPLATVELYANLLRRALARGSGVRPAARRHQGPDAPVSRPDRGDHALDQPGRRTRRGHDADAGRPGCARCRGATCAGRHEDARDHAARRRRRPGWRSPRTTCARW